jgi:ketosteroid isomerase-like protein
MSEENVKIALEGYELLNSGVREPQLKYWHEDGEYRVAREDPDSTIHRGIDALRRHYASWMEAYPDLKVEPQEARSNGDMVFLWVRFSGHGGASGAPMETELAHVLTMREGRIAVLAEFTDREEALREAGLAK